MSTLFEHPMTSIKDFCIYWHKDWRMHISILSDDVFFWRNGTWYFNFGLSISFFESPSDSEQKL